VPNQQMLSQLVELMLQVSLCLLILLDKVNELLHKSQELLTVFLVQKACNCGIERGDFEQ
jgi:hypothetical protein